MQMSDQMSIPSIKFVVSLATDPTIAGWLLCCSGCLRLPIAISHQKKRGNTLDVSPLFLMFIAMI